MSELRHPEVVVVARRQAARFIHRKKVKMWVKEVFRNKRALRVILGGNEITKK